MALNNPNPLGPWKVSVTSCHGWLTTSRFLLISCLAWRCQWHVCVSVHTSVCARGMCILHVCICVLLSRSQFTTRKTSKGSVWSLPRPARTSWSVASTTSAPWRWSVERESNNNSHRRKLPTVNTSTCHCIYIWFYNCTNGPSCCVYMCSSACWGQLGRIWALQLLWTAVCAGERRVSSLGVVERQQRLPHWEDDVLPPHLLCCEFLSHSNGFCFHSIWLLMCLQKRDKKSTKFDSSNWPTWFLVWQACRVTHGSCWLQLKINYSAVWSHAL